MKTAYWKVLLCDEYMNELPDENGKYPWQVDRNVLKSGKIELTDKIETDADLCDFMEGHIGGFESCSCWESRPDNESVFVMRGDSPNAENCWEWMELECGFVKTAEPKNDSQPEPLSASADVKMFDALLQNEPYETAQEMMSVGSIINVASNFIALGTLNEKDLESYKTELAKHLYNIQEKVNNMVFIIETDSEDVSTLLDERIESENDHEDPEYTQDMVKYVNPDYEG